MRRRRAVVVGLLFSAVIMAAALSPLLVQDAIRSAVESLIEKVTPDGVRETEGFKELDALEVKGRAPKTGYARTEFGNGWGKIQGCNVRQVILHRDLTDIVMKDECTVESGLLADPYTGKRIEFSRADSSAVQIDHVVALSDAWQKGAQQLTKERRKELANDPLNLLASDGPANQEKGDSDAATWLPPNKVFRCEYVQRQVAVKRTYQLWVTQAEYDAMARVLNAC